MVSDIAFSECTPLRSATLYVLKGGGAILLDAAVYCCALMRMRMHLLCTYLEHLLCDHQGLELGSVEEINSTLISASSTIVALGKD